MALAAGLLLMTKIARRQSDSNLDVVTSCVLVVPKVQPSQDFVSVYDLLLRSNNFDFPFLMAQLSHVVLFIIIIAYTVNLYTSTRAWEWNIAYEMWHH